MSTSEDVDGGGVAAGRWVSKAVVEGVAGSLKAAEISRWEMNSRDCEFSKDFFLFHCIFFFEQCIFFHCIFF